MTNQTPLLSAFTRVFIIAGRAGPDRVPAYQSCMKMTGLSRNFGDVTPVECPDPKRYGEFEEVASIRGAKERAKTSLVGRYAAELRSLLLKLADQRCAVDVQLHVGQCESADSFNEFQKNIILEGAVITSHATDDLGVLESGENSKVDETAEVSAKSYYEVVPISYTSKAGNIVTTEIVDVAICDQISCGDCTDPSEGCEKLYAITKNANGSPGQPADIVFSVDGGVNWFAHDIDSLVTPNDPNAMACMGSYVVVVSNSDNAQHYVPKSELNGIIDPAWTRVATGYTVGEPNDIWVADSTWAFVVGDWGAVYLCTDPTAGVTVLDAGVATTSTLNHVHGLSRDFAVAVGSDGAMVYTINGTNWNVTPGSPVGLGIHLYAVAVKSEKEWWVGGSNGRLYYTKDGGTTWAEKPFPGSGFGSIRDIVIATDSVFYLSHKTALTKGRILRSFDGGNSWIVTPEGNTPIPAADWFNALATCDADPNFLLAGGLGDSGTDGIILVGSGD